MITSEYAAGFMDGEGSINVHTGVDKRTGRPVTHWRVQITQVERRKEVLEQFAERWGGKVHSYPPQNPKHSPFSVWSLGGKCMIMKFLMDVYPSLVVKKAEAGFMMLGIRDEISAQETTELISADRRG